MDDERERFYKSVKTQIHVSIIKGLKYCYIISMKGSKAQIRYVQNRLENEGYLVEVKQCKSCLNTWDIIITLY